MRIFRAALFCIFLSFSLPAQTATPAADVFSLKNRIAVPGEIVHISLAEDENKLYLIGKQNIQLWDLSTDKLVKAYPHEFSPIAPIGFIGKLLNIPYPLMMLRYPLIMNVNNTRGIAFPAKNETGSRAAALWDLRSGKKLGLIQRPGKNIRDVDFSGDGKTIISTHGELADMEIVIWDTETLSVRNYIAVHDLSWMHLSNDGEKVFITTGKANTWAGNVFGYDDTNRIDLLNARTGKLERSFKASGIKSASTMGSSPTLDKDERLIAARTGDDVTVWDTSGDGTPKYVVNEKVKRSYRPLRISDDGRFLVTVPNNIINIYELETGKVYKSIQTASVLDSCYLSPNGHYLIERYTGNVAVTDLESGKFLYNLDIDTYDQKDYTSGLSTTYESENAAVSPNSKFIMIYGAKQVRIFNIADGKLLQTLVDPQTVKYKDSGKLKDDGLDGVTASWIGDGDSVRVLGDSDRIYFQWNAK
jgi:WD40 repeat protein